MDLLPLKVSHSHSHSQSLNLNLILLNDSKIPLLFVVCCFLFLLLSLTPPNHNLTQVFFNSICGECNLQIAGIGPL
jgi:hypothetical protein